MLHPIIHLTTNLLYAPALVDDQEHHEGEEAAERRGYSDPRHHVVSLVEFDFQLLPLAERRRGVRQDCRRSARRRAPRRVAEAARHTCNVQKSFIILLSFV